MSSVSGLQPDETAFSPPSSAAWPRAFIGRWFQSLGAKVGACLVALLIVVAVVGPLVAGFDPDESDFVAGIDPRGGPIGPSMVHWLGTDALFRDVLARLCAGARLSLSIAVCSTLVSTVIGAAVGITSGYMAGSRWALVDSILMRSVDILLAIPNLLLVMAIGATMDRTTPLTVMIVLGVTSWLGTARVVRAKTLQVREQGFVEASRAMGQSTFRILLLHILPNVAGPLLVSATMSMAGMILAESVLSYLQVGVAPPTATWGRMLIDGQRTMSLMPRLVIAPGIAIVASVLGFNLVGEGLRDAIDTKEVRG